MLTYEAIRKLAMDEKAAAKLVGLPEDFFEAVRTYLEKKGRISENKEDRWEFDSARRWLQDLLDIRERKILTLALSFVKTGATPGEITLEEKVFFGKLVEQIKEFETGEKDIIEGKREKLIAVALLQDVPAFVGINMRNYGPLKKGDVISLPEENARLLLERQAAKKIDI